MNKKTGKIGIILLLSLCLGPFSFIQADANSLTQLDIRKANSASSTVDVMLYTTTPYADSIAVTKKSDNKYVILMPNVSSAAGGKPDLSGIKDIISDIDVKSVNDGAGGYTKVTLITTKPLNIRAQAKNTVPLTPEQKAYKNLIAQSRTHTNTPVYIPDSRKLEPKTTVTVNKPVQPVKMVPAKQQTQEAAPQKKESILDTAQQKLKTAAKPKEVRKTDVQKNETVKTGNTKSVQSKPVKEDISKHVPDVLLPAAKADVKPPVKHNGIETGLKLIKQHIDNILPNMPVTLAMILIPVLGLLFLLKLIKSSIISSTFLRSSFKEHLETQPVLATDYEEIISNPNLNWQEKYQKFIAETGSKVEKLKSKKYSFITPQANTKVQYDLAEDTVKIQPKAAANPAPVSKFAAVKASKKAKGKTIKMDDAVVELEKQIEKLEAEKAVEPAKISQAPKAQDMPKSQTPAPVQEEKKVNDMMENEKYLVSLEKLLHESPDVEKTPLDEESILKTLEQNFRDITVQSEDDMIASKMTEVAKNNQTAKIKKLKAFADKVALEETHRNKPLPKTREEVRNSSNKEGRHVNLGYSALHSNPRMLDGGNLSVADLIAKSSKFMRNPAPKTEPLKPSENVFDKPAVFQNQSKPVFENEKGYTMSSLEEFFALPEENNGATASASLSNKVAESLAQIKPSMKMQKAVPAKDNVTNPIAQLKADTKENYLNGLIVKSGYNIDKNRGFYIVNLDGETALVGRIKEEIFVLKKFSGNVERPIQVRQDNPNVYMVKADGFRSLVEVDNDKMNVLIEL